MLHSLQGGQDPTTTIEVGSILCVISVILLSPLHLIEAKIPEIIILKTKEMFVHEQTTAHPSVTESSKVK